MGDSTDAQCVQLCVAVALAGVQDADAGDAGLCGRPDGIGGVLKQDTVLCTAVELPKEKVVDGRVAFGQAQRLGRKSSLGK